MITEKKKGKKEERDGQREGGRRQPIPGRKGGTSL